MTYCFDTSGINELLDDKRITSIVSKLMQASTTYVSALNIWEAGRTKSLERRSRLMNLLSSLASGCPPLDIPPDIVRRAFEAYISGNRTINIYAGDNRRDIVLILADPSLLSEEHLTMFNDEHDELESSFLEMHRSARPHMQACMDNPKVDTPTPHEFVNHMLSENGIYQGYVNSIIHGVSPSYEPLSYDDSIALSSSYPEVLYFFVAWMYATYKRGLAQTNYGKNNAGNVDIWFSVYLPHLDYFITHDIPQYEAMSFISHLTDSSCAVLKYRTFREQIFSDGA